MISHAPSRLGPLGTLFIESKRHFLDDAEMTDESASLGPVMRKIYAALKTHTGTEQIYQVTLMDSVPHFHSWLGSHRKEGPEKGIKFLTRDDACSDEDAIALANKLHEAMNL